MELSNCERELTGESYWLAEDVQMTGGELCSVFLGPCGAYVITELAKRSPQQLYSDLKQLLDVHHLRLYVIDAGIYDSSEDCFDPSLEAAKVSQDVEHWLFNRRPLYKPHTIECMISKLRLEEAKTVGYMETEDGSLFIYRHGALKPASPCDSEKVFTQNLYGGCFGLHRFAVGKWGTGILYLLTCGVFLMGWATDLLFHFLSIQKDRQKRYLLPLSNRRAKILPLITGLLLNIIILNFYLLFMEYAFDGLMLGTAGQLDPSDATFVSTFMDWLSSILSDQ